MKITYFDFRKKENVLFLNIIIIVRYMDNFLFAKDWKSLKMLISPNFKLNNAQWFQLKSYYDDLQSTKFEKEIKEKQKWLIILKSN